MKQYQRRQAALLFATLTGLLTTTFVVYYMFVPNNSLGGITYWDVLILGSQRTGDVIWAYSVMPIMLFGTSLVWIISIHTLFKRNSVSQPGWVETSGQEAPGQEWKHHR